jgi:hypothetical protein
MAAKGSSYTTEFIICPWFSVIGIQVNFEMFCIFYGFCVVTCTNLVPRRTEKQNKKNGSKNEKFWEICSNAAQNNVSMFRQTFFLRAKTTYRACKNTKS